MAKKQDEFTVDTQEVETTINYYLDDGVEAEQPSEGWHNAQLVDFAIQPNKAQTGDNMVFNFELAEDDPDRPGMRFTQYIAMPTEETAQNFKEWLAAGKPRDWGGGYIKKDGRHAHQNTMNRIKRIMTAFGGPESGTFDFNYFFSCIGSMVKINLKLDKDSDVTRMNITYNGIAPF